MMEIGLFQLENLARTPTQFRFFDLRATIGPVPAPVEALMRLATPSSPEELTGRLGEASSDFAMPVLLVCLDGKLSSETADRLERSGYNQVYVVAGGVTGLVAEALLES